MAKKIIFFISILIIIVICTVIYVKMESKIRYKKFQQTEQAAKIIVNAIKQYHDKNNKYPAKLDNLIPEFLPEIEKPKWGDSGWVYIYSEEGFIIEVGYHFSKNDDYLYPSLRYSTTDYWFFND